LARKWLFIAALTMILIASAFQSLAYGVESYYDYMSVGKTLFQQGQFANAIESFSHAIALESDSSEARKYRGMSYYFMGNVSSALTDLSTISENDSNSKLTREEFCLFIARKLGLSPVTSPDMQYSDIDVNRWSAPYIYAVSQANIMNGYPDGHFAPEENFTRAEMVRRIEWIMRHKYHIPISTPTMQHYTDVTADYWAYSYIELMGRFNIMPATEDGSFLPEQNTSAADLIEVLEKLPVGDLNGDDLVNFNDLSAAAAAYASQNQAADLNGDGVVDLFDLHVISRQISYTLLKDEFEPGIQNQDVFIMDCSVDSSGGYVIWYYIYDDSTGEISSLKSASLDPNYVFANAQNILGMIGHFCDPSWDDDQKVVSIRVQDYPVLTSNKLLVTNGKVKINDVEYAFAPTDIAVEGFEAAPNALLLAPESIPNNTYDAADIYKVVLNKDNQVSAIIAKTLPLPGIVQNVEGKVIQFGNTPPVKDLTVRLSHLGEWDGFADQGDFTGCSVLVERDGKFSSFDKIQPMDTVNVLKNYRGVNYYLLVSSKKQAGNLLSFSQSGDEITKLEVLGMDWFPSYVSGDSTSFYYSFDNGYAYRSGPDPVTLEKALNKNVTLLLGATGKIAGLITDLSDCVYGIITNISPLLQSNGELGIPVSSGSNYRKVDLLKGDGAISEYYITGKSFIDKTGPNGSFSKKIVDLSNSDSYSDTYYSLQNIEGLIQAFAQPDELVSGLVRVNVNAEGIAIRIGVIGQTKIPLTTYITNADNDWLKLNGEWYSARDAVVFNLINGTGGAATSSMDLVNTTLKDWTALENNTAVTVFGYHLEAPCNVDYIVVSPSPVIGQYGIFTQQFSDSDGDWIVLKGEEAYKAGSVTPPTLAKGDVICYTTEGNTINILGVAIPYGSTSKSTVDIIERGIIKLNDNTSYMIDEYTRFFDVCDCHYLQILDGLCIGDTVRVIPDEREPGRAAVIAVVE